MIDRILTGGRIYDGVTSDHRITALAIGDGRIVALGDDGSIRAMAERETIEDRLEGRSVIPGLIDAHLHLSGMAKAIRELDLSEVPNKDEAVNRVAERAKRLKPGEWLTGRGWVQDIWPSHKFPSASDLDAVAPDNPVYLIAKSGHAAWINSLAMKIAGITMNTPDPPGGALVRDEAGNPIGVLLEEPAMTLVTDHMPPTSAEQLAVWLLDVQERLWRAGLTGVHDMDGPECLSALQILHQGGKLGIRVLKYIRWDHIYDAIRLGIRSGFGDDRLRIGGIKLFADGALGPRTAHMIAPYEGEDEYRGMPVTDKDTLYEMVSTASVHGLPSAVHAIGDQAVRDVLDVFEAVRAEEAGRGIPRELMRHRIEHLQIVHPEDANRPANLGIITSMQPVHALSDMEMAERHWGARTKWSYHWRMQVDSGAILAFGSDAPVEPVEPLLGIQAAVTRRRLDGHPGPEGWHPEARLTLNEALAAYTTGPAYAAGMEDILGKLAPGYIADLVVLDEDISAANPMTIHKIPVVGTMVGGVWKYRDF